MLLAQIAEVSRTVAATSARLAKIELRTAVDASDDPGRVASRPGVGETTVTPTPPPDTAPHGAHQVTASGNNVGKTTSPNWVRVTVCATVRIVTATQLDLAAEYRRAGAA